MSPAPREDQSWESAWTFRQCVAKLLQTERALPHVEH